MSASGQTAHAGPGRVNWRRFAAIMVPAFALAGVLVVLTAQSVLAVSFSISGTPFTVKNPPCSFPSARRRLGPDRQNRPGDFVRPVGRATFAPERVGLQIHILEALERDLRGDVDGLRDRAVDVLLHRGLHDDMVFGG